MTKSQFDLSGKVALITGGNGGIGLGMAESIARAGGDVCIWGTNAKKNTAALSKLETYGGHVSAMLCDVSDEVAVERCFSDIVREFGHVDGCFANAGVSGGRDAVPFIDITTEAWRRVTSVNLDGAFFTLRAAARHMVERGEGGRLCGTASLAAISGAARNEHYAATKGGLISMLVALSVELARYEITSNAILPGWIETAMTEKAIAWGKFSDAVKPRIPMGRWGQPEDFGGIAAYIMSDASSFHTGDTFLIDGGYQKF